MSPTGTHRGDELPRSLILRTLLAALMIGVALCFGTYLFLRERLLALRPSYRFPEQTLPAPREVAGVRQEVFQMPHPQPSVRDRQRAELDGFAWVDRRRRIVHIPVDAALDLVARESRAGGRP